MIVCGCASAHIAPTQQAKFKPSNNETLLMLGLRKLAQHRWLNWLLGMSHVESTSYHYQYGSRYNSNSHRTRLVSALARRPMSSRVRCKGQGAGGAGARISARTRAEGAGHAGPLPPAPPRPTAVRATRATREERSLYCHSTAPKRGSGSTRIRGRPTSSPAASSPQQRLSTETAALSPSTQYSPG